MNLNLTQRIPAVVRLRCSHCLQGACYERPFKMRSDCPVCHTHFEREDGYWTMSIFMGYVIYFLVMLPICLAMYFLGVAMREFIIVSAVIVVILTPIVFHYARVLWLHTDEILDPRREDDFITTP